mmetsp:Transcript_5679/g.10838  ORF Transcript_5679/g.10838 Transcript_5679/m.10838 type:complete len:145 (+) Transcript_5679:11-445(+)|eukprot:CAMPEP_0175164936 /NCGR_PEP_ID=MMETSP0087-20121206/26737_1 /TAXON_ID=136419 /ORGANISM="Unknown Unknown, Strain D1" /LENGTH=144 /DNA_ID=CAMNT_0016454117 /DNA_START=11 /DNA_END=445 /DNA_ORIENTATION=-
MFVARRLPQFMGFRLCPTFTRTFHSSVALFQERPKVKVQFVLPDGEEIAVEGDEGQSLLDIAQDNDIDEIEGACEGTCCCSTCHVILEQALYDSLPAPQEEELDMLDLAPSLTDTSRLGCQVLLKKEMDGMKVVLPEESFSQLD